MERKESGKRVMQTERNPESQLKKMVCSVHGEHKGPAAPRGNPGQKEVPLHWIQ